MSIVTVWVASADTESERRFDRGMTLDELKTRLEPITGIPADAQVLTLHQGEALLANMSGGPDVLLGFYPVADFCTIRVASSDRAIRPNQYTDVSQVEKFELEDKQYDSLTDSVRAFKRAHKIGRFSEEHKEAEKLAENKFEAEAKVLSLGARCQVKLSDEGLAKNGTVRYIGKTKFAPGFWVGVEYDEPLGKNDGSIDGEQYFTCASKHGAFVRPDKVTLGDFKDDIDWDNLDEM
ncbi:hypothetical protein IWQ60_009966 [Tieghemiomyces parasiticus]|uniref:CAP-Gly domain-containing protein n=1 Tax=Tieghemiomyces parasiticus TaxID=78921 RepID=A0A9W7ZL99_9FUNG|nr:hypothetical protein IWQ60_009966 [Tieghemiomyces parasiticus]